MFTPAPNIFQTATQTMNALDALRKHKLERDLLHQKMRGAPHLQAQADEMARAKLQNILAQTGLTQAKTRGLPELQKQQQALRQAQIQAAGIVLI